jgi:hypothetical protein
VKPAPATEAALTVTPELPPDDRINVWVEAEFTLSLPNDKLNELTLSAMAAAPSCTPKVSVTPFAVADNVTACATFTAFTNAENVALFAPPATVTAGGTVIAGLLLATLTANPPLPAAALNVSVQVSVPAPVIDALAQLSAVSVGTPVPLRLTAVEAPEKELLFRVREPESVPAATGSNWTVSVTVWLGFRVIGNEAPLTAKPVPAIDNELMASGKFPVEERVSVCVACVFRFTLPNEIPEELTVSLAPDATSCSENVAGAPPVLAVSVAASVELTGETFAVKFALLAPAATVTEAGTLTSELLLEIPTVNPPLAAGVFTATMQLSVPDPTNELLAQLSPVNAGTPVPLRPITVEPEPVALLAIDSCPACPPAAVGLNSTLSVSV